MPRLTDAEIQTAIRKGKQRRMADGDGRGSGRLVLVIKPRKADGVTSDWYAQQWVDGKRTTVKIGAYPALSLAQARVRYAAQYGETIAQGKTITQSTDDRAGTLDDLILGYVDSLRKRGSPSASDNLQRLQKFAAAVDGSREARDIKTADVIEFLKSTYRRGKESLADHDRSYIRAAYSWGIASENDYRSTAKKRRFFLTTNPAAAIPSAAKKVGNRWLDEAEFRRVYRWLGSTAARLTPANSVALRVLMLTGQRVQEIAGLQRSQWISAERLLVWPTTKNGRPHAVPVCDLAAGLLDTLPDESEWLFPMETDPERCVHHGSLYSLMWRNRESIGVEPFSNRDLRRTWKTLAGKAGLTKWDRDLLQNHARTDVSSAHYDRHDYLEEKRAAVEKWGKWIRAVVEA